MATKRSVKAGGASAQGGSRGAGLGERGSWRRSGIVVVAALHKCWTAALAAQNRIVDGLQGAEGLHPQASAAAHCYAVALIEPLPLRETAKALYLATADAGNLDARKAAATRRRGEEIEKFVRRT